MRKILDCNGRETKPKDVCGTLHYVCHQQDLTTLQLSTSFIIFVLIRNRNAQFTQLDNQNNDNNTHFLLTLEVRSPVFWGVGSTFGKCRDFLTPLDIQIH